MKGYSDEIINLLMLQKFRLLPVFSKTFFGYCNLFIFKKLK